MSVFNTTVRTVCVDSRKHQVAKPLYIVRPGLGDRKVRIETAGVQRRTSRADGGQGNGHDARRQRIRWPSVSR